MHDFAGKVFTNYKNKVRSQNIIAVEFSLKLLLLYKEI